MRFVTSLSSDAFLVWLETSESGLKVVANSSKIKLSTESEPFNPFSSNEEGLEKN